MERQFLSGVIEGFYGRPWTTDQRIKLFARLKKLGLSTYLYAPKDDARHRALWRELYSVEETDVLSSLIDAANKENVDFVYAISPGLDIVYSNTADVGCLKRKLDQVRRLGCQSFALLFDDIKKELPDADRDTFQSLAAAQVSVTNEMFQHLGEPRSFFFCPTEYCDSRARPTVSESTYLSTIGSKLLPPIDIMWTGPKVISRKISVQSIEEVSEVLQRPPLIWDNYHANDYDHSRVFLGPLEGRPLELRPYVRGILTNPSREFEANFVALHTLSQWTKCSSGSVKKDIVSGESPLPTEVLLLETDGDFVPDEDSLIHSFAQPYIPRQALKIAISEWHDEFMVKCNMPDDLLASYVTPLITAPPVDTTIPDSGPIPLEFTDADFLSTAPKLGSSLSGALPSGEDKLNVGGAGEPMDCCFATTSGVASMQDDETANGETMQIDADVSTPVVSAVTLEDVTLLADLFYLPFEYGRQTNELLSELDWIISNIGHREWTERQCVMIERLIEISRAFDRICDIPNKAIFTELYPYLWATKIVISILVCFLQWIALGKVPSGCQCFIHGPATWSSEEYQHRLCSGEFEPWLTKGGVIRELQKMLPYECNSDLHFYSCPPPSDSVIFTVRPYRDSDKASVVNLFQRWCQICNNNNSDLLLKDSGIQLEIFAEVMIGSFLNYSPEFCFVIEDRNGTICAYVLGTMDAASFFDKVYSQWVPKVMEQYKDVHENNETSEEFMKHLDAYKTCLLDNQIMTYPSLLRIDFNPELLLDRSALKRAVSCAVAALKISGSCGVYTRVPMLHPQLMELYFNLGLCEIGFRNAGATVLVRGISSVQMNSALNPSSSGGNVAVSKWCHMCSCCCVI